jgi:hypothetical protein
MGLSSLDIVSFTRASDDIQNSDKIRSLLKDIREARQAKSREGLQKIDHSELSVRDNARCRLYALTVAISYPIYALWKSMKYDRSLCAPWAYSRSSPVTLRPTHDNSAFDFKTLIHIILQVPDHTGSIL